MKNTLFAVLFLSSSALGACGGSSTNTSGDAAGSTSGDLASSSAPIAGVETCMQSDYVDARTDASMRTFAVWDTTFGTKCLHITAGQSVTWTGVPTTAHPLQAHGTGSANNPIMNVSVNTFPTAGTYGFECSIHTTLMHGAIWVD